MTGMGELFWGVPTDRQALRRAAPPDLGAALANGSR